MPKRLWIPAARPVCIAGAVLCVLYTGCTPSPVEITPRPAEIGTPRRSFTVVSYNIQARPLLDDCAMCGRTDPVEPVFDAAQGVVLCKTCAGPAGGLPLDAGALAAMRHIVGAPSKRLLSFTLEPASLARLSVACETFAAVQLDRRFRTLDFYKSIRST